MKNIFISGGLGQDGQILTKILLSKKNRGGNESPTRPYYIRFQHAPLETDSGYFETIKCARRFWNQQVSSLLKQKGFSSP